MGIVARFEQDGDAVYSYFRGGREISWYFRSMYEVLTPGQPAILTREMKRLVEELEKF